MNIWIYLNLTSIIIVIIKITVNIYNILLYINKFYNL